MIEHYGDQVACLRYYTDGPLYNFNPQHVNARRSFYNAGDGYTYVDGAYYYYTSIYARVGERINVNSPLAFNVCGNFNPGSGDIMLEIKMWATDPVTQSDPRLHCVITENNTGGRNQVMRYFLPDPDGEQFDINQGDTLTFTREGTLSEVLRPENCNVLLFVQDHNTKEILQAHETPFPQLLPLDGWGILAGRVYDEDTGDPLSATLTVINRDSLIECATDDDGYYTLILPADSVWGIRCVEATGNYAPDSALVMVPERDSSFCNFELPYPDVHVNTIVTGGPISVMPGGFFTFIGILRNNTPVQQRTDFWIMLDVPGYGRYGPLTRYNNITLQPNQQVMRWNARLDVPVFAPLGEYTYYAFVGDYPADIMHLDYFPFTVYGVDGGNAGSWNVSGWIEGDAPENTPSDYTLFGNYPNPFNAQTTISFDLPTSGVVNLSIYNVMGQRVETLVDGHVQAGHHDVTWDASTAASGVYFYKLSVGDKVFTRRMTLLK